jgi:hypothetical protein
MHLLFQDVIAIGPELRPLYVAQVDSPFARRVQVSGLSASEYASTLSELTHTPLSEVDIIELRTRLVAWSIVDLRSQDDTRDLLISAYRRHQVFVADTNVIWHAMREMRDRIAKIAVSKIGATEWSEGVTNGVYGPGTNKCNLFVHDVLTAAGADPGLPHGWRHPSPPMASDWANPSYDIPQWRPLTAGEHPEPGDVVAQSAHYADATGHVMIVGPGGGGTVTFVGTADGPNYNPQGVVAQIPQKPMIVDPATDHGPEVFRRWDPLK